MAVFDGIIIANAKSRAIPGSIIVEGEKITAVLPSAEIKQNFYITPAFIDSHTHPLETGLGMIYPDFSSANSIADVLDILSASIIQMHDVPVVLGFNLDPDRLKEHRYPYRRELDRLTNKKPVMIYRVDCHSAAINSKALEVVSETNCAGVELDGAGKPTGVVRGITYETLSEKLKRLLPHEIVQKAVDLTAQMALRNGVIALGAMVGADNYTENEWRILLDSLSKAPIRMIPFLQTWNVKIAELFSLSRIGGCLLLDGSFGSHTAALSEDYADAPGYRGMLYQNDSRIVKFLQEAQKMNLQTAFHAIGDRAIEQIVRCHEMVEYKTSFGSPRHRIEHAELLSAALIKRIAQLGLVVSVQPTFETIWGGAEGMYARRLGNRWRNTNPYRTLLDNKIVVAGSSDAPITPLDPLRGIHAAINLPNEDQRLTASEAMLLFTENAAYSLGIENFTGRLAPGMEANFVILTADPREIADCQILATCYRGQLFCKDASMLKR
ncbi:MAG: amidohydrolase [bacterium]